MSSEGEGECDSLAVGHAENERAARRGLGGKGRGMYRGRCKSNRCLALLGRRAAKHATAALSNSPARPLLFRFPKKVNKQQAR